MTFRYPTVHWHMHKAITVRTVLQEYFVINWYRSSQYKVRFITGF